MAQPPPPPFGSRFAGPPQRAAFPPPALPPPGPFRGPPPQLFPRALYPPFQAGGLPPPAGPPFLPPPPPPPPPPQWPPAPPQLPERPPLPWRPEGPPRPAPEASDAPGDEACDRDEAWLSRFAARRRPSVAAAAASRSPRQERGLTAGEAAQAAGEALRALARVAGLCAAWRRRGDEAAPGEVAAAEAGLEELRALVRPLRDPGALQLLRARLERGRRKRRRRRRRRQEARAARQEEAARRAEREARVNLWRARRAQEAEDRHREQELKAAADSVLSEVRKKQADTKRMAEILRGLEKLRKLRKEAAGRKGVCPPPAADEAFESEVQNLRASIKKRTELYEAEERALRVMLEGEQEEERKREMEKKQKKEREKLLQQKREMDSKLFGDPEEFPLAHFLEPFTQYYLQAECSLPALIQIRHEWDQYLVPAGHPEGDFIPPGWVLPSPPSSDTWATAVR